MKRLLAATALALLASPVLAQGFVQSPAYKECTALASSAPQKALEKSDEWLKLDDGFAAHHCRAMALYGLGQFPQAAEELGLVREKIDGQNLALRTYVTVQASQAWVAAGQSDRALAVLGAQINNIASTKNDNATEAKFTSELLLERARLLLKYGKATDAVQDLDHAISLTPLDEDVLMTRALAFEQLNDFPLARADANSVLKLKPGDEKATALLARLKGK